MHSYIQIRVHLPTCTHARTSKRRNKQTNTHATIYTCTNDKSMQNTSDLLLKSSIIGCYSAVDDLCDVDVLITGFFREWTVCTAGNREAKAFTFLKYARCSNVQKKRYCFLLLVLGTWGNIGVHSIRFNSIRFHSIPLHSIPFHSTLLNCIALRSVPFHSIPFHSIIIAINFK